ncbi:MAG: restriction endonuclease subunit S [Saprospiraceae bacterium]
MKLRKDKWLDIEFPEAIDFQEGPGILAKDFRNHGVPLIRLAGMDDGVSLLNGCNFLDEELVSRKYEHFKLKKGDIILSTSATLGKTSFVDDEAVGAIVYTGLVRMRPKDGKVYAPFIKYLLQSPRFTEQIESMGVGSVMKHFGPTHLKRISVTLPSIDEQKNISNLFPALETAMEHVDVQEKNLLQLKNKLLSDLFSDKKEFGNQITAKDFETVRFDKIAINISERVEPKKTELTTYVGLEHLDADNLVIERTGTPDDVIGTKLKIYKGDIIFGKRRAYLRKVAVSHFDGIASAHSMILRANEKHIEKDFLPYFMQSDAFMNRAVQISEGSLSPTIKVKTLAQQEFTLPKKEKQKELVALFKQFDETRQQLKQQKATLKLLKQKLLNEILG